MLYGIPDPVLDCSSINTSSFLSSRLPVWRNKDCLFSFRTEAKLFSYFQTCCCGPSVIQIGSFRNPCNLNKTLLVFCVPTRKPGASFLNDLRMDFTSALPVLSECLKKLRVVLHVLARQHLRRLRRTLHKFSLQVQKLPRVTCKCSQIQYLRNWPQTCFVRRNQELWEFLIRNTISAGSPEKLDVA